MASSPTGGTTTRVVWSGDLQANLKRFDGVMHARLAAIAGYAASEMERYAKLSAPWQDQTGNARNGLKGEPIVRGHEYGASLSHGVPYGIWLEVRWAGRYAIIGPTILHTAPLVAEMVRGLLRGKL